VQLFVIETACHVPKTARMASDERTANLLGALALTLTDSVGAALGDEVGVAGTDLDELCHGPAPQLI
jgi:hypothetical protein